MEGREHTYNSGRIRRADTLPGLDTAAVRRGLRELERTHGEFSLNLSAEEVMRRGQSKRRSASEQQRYDEPPLRSRRQPAREEYNTQQERAPRRGTGRYDAYDEPDDGYDEQLDDEYYDDYDDAYEDDYDDNYDDGYDDDYDDDYYEEDDFSARGRRQNAKTSGDRQAGKRQDARYYDDDLMDDGYDDEYEDDYYDDPPPLKRPAGKKKKKRWPMVLLIIFLVLLLAVSVALALFLRYAQNDLLDTGQMGMVAASYYTPEAYKGDVVNILLVGIDNEENRSYAPGLGQTDLILYINYNLRDNKMNLLQIPRDSYVGDFWGNNGKINSLLISGPDTENPINNLVSIISDQYKLPIDHYISMDMDGFRDIVDAFYGLNVYVPKPMSHEGSYLEPGWHVMNGEIAEFFVRNRYGSGFERADIDRLENQRYFYSALFRRFMNMTPRDVVKLMPIFDYYCNTDIGLTTLGQLGVSALSLESENVLFCRVPGATSKTLDPTGSGRDMFFVDVYGRGTEAEPGIATLLNQYFREFGDPVPAAELNFPKVNIPSNVALYPPGVQTMGEVQAGEDPNVDVEAHLKG